MSSRNAQSVFHALRTLNIIDDTLEPSRREGEVTVPVIRVPTAMELRKLEDLSEDLHCEQAQFIDRRSRPVALRDRLASNIPEDLMQHVPRSYDIIGNIAIVDLPVKLEEFEHDVGDAILRINPNLRLVLRKASITDGEFRIRKLEKIAGGGSTETCYREHSCKYKLDVATVYFNPRLSGERIRVAKQTCPGETVVDMFAGVGPYSVLIARLQPQARVFSVDLNPEAIRYLRENVMINGVAERVVPITGDIASVSLGRLRASADRIIMNLPADAYKFIPAATRLLKNRGGIIHYYCFTGREIDSKSAQNDFCRRIEEQGRRVDSILHSRVLKEITPSKVQFAIDARVK